MDVERQELGSRADPAPQGVEATREQPNGRALGLLVANAALVSLVAVGARLPVLFDDPHAPGYDGWYYVLQVRSLLDGEALFADSSLVFPTLGALGWVLGDVVLGNKLGALAFAAAGSVGASIAARRWTGSSWAGLAAGLVWAAAPGHLVLTGEFLKNEAGLAVLGTLLAVLPDCERRWPMWVSAAGLAVLGLFVHKLTGVLGLSLALGYGVCRAARGRVPPWVLLAAAGLALLGAAGWGLLRPVDLERFVGDAVGAEPRWSAILTSERIATAHRVELLLAHLVPLLLGLTLVGPGGRRLRDLGLPLTLVAVVTTAPGLSFGFDLTSWRLLLMGFVPLALGVAAAVARVPSPARSFLVLPLATLLLLQLPSTAARVARAEPDYVAWEGALPTLQATVPPADRVVAHRGLCGFVWAVGDRICENFEPQGPPEGWWRISYGVAVDELAPYTDQPVVRLRTAYTLAPETAWRAWRADHPEHPFANHVTNPNLPRPSFVYGPQGDTPHREEP